MLEKESIRKQVKQAVKTLSETEKHLLSQQVMMRLESLACFQNAKTIMVYASLPDEVETNYILQHYAKEKLILLPVVCGEELQLYPFKGFNNLCIGSYGIKEPCRSENPFTDYKTIELIITPGVAFDKQLHRLGRGKGYYDRFLANNKLTNAYKIGICYPCQVIENIPTETHDISIDELITTL